MGPPWTDFIRMKDKDYVFKISERVLTLYETFKENDYEITNSPKWVLYKIQ